MVQILVPFVTFVLDANQNSRHERKKHLHKATLTLSTDANGAGSNEID